MSGLTHIKFADETLGSPIQLGQFCSDDHEHVNRKSKNERERKKEKEKEKEHEKAFSSLRYEQANK